VSDTTSSISERTQTTAAATSLTSANETGMADEAFCFSRIIYNFIQVSKIAVSLSTSCAFLFYTLRKLIRFVPDLKKRQFQIK